PARRRLALLAGAVAAGVMSHYFFLLTLAAGVIWVAACRGPVRRVLTAIAIGLLPLAVWLPAFVKQYQHHRFVWIGPFRLRAALEAYPALLVRSLPGGAWGYLLDACVIALVLGGAARL